MRARSRTGQHLARDALEEDGGADQRLDERERLQQRGRNAAGGSRRPGLRRLLWWLLGAPEQCVRERECEQVRVLLREQVRRRLRRRQHHSQGRHTHRVREGLLTERQLKRITVHQCN